MNALVLNFYLDEFFVVVVSMIKKNTKKRNLQFHFFLNNLVFNYSFKRGLRNMKVYLTKNEMID